MFFFAQKSSSSCVSARLPTEEQRRGVGSGQRAEIAHHHERAVHSQQRHVRIDLMLHQDGVDDEVEAGLPLGHRFLVRGNEQPVGAQFQGVGFLVASPADDGHIGAQFARELDRHMPKPSQTCHGDPAPWTDVAQPERQPVGNARAQQGHCTRGVETIGQAQDELQRCRRRP
jgi:hypothetical protein